MLTVNQEITLTIASLSHGGSGVGRIEDFVVFVPFTAPQDVARVQITSLKKNYADGRLLEIISPSPQRIKAPCSVFEICGGCQWQHVDYQEQLHQKQLIVEHALQRIAKEENILILPIIPSPKPFYYRNRAQVRAEGGKVGFYQRHSHNIIEFEKCWIIDEKIDQEISQIKKERVGLDPFKTAKIEIFLSEDGTVYRSLNRAHAEERGFAQVNTEQNMSMIDYICSVLPGPATVDSDNQGSRGNLLDLYCGNGNFSLPLNKMGWRIYGVDSNRSAIHSAREKANAQTFYSAGDCLVEVKKLAAKNRKYEVVLLDPPRIGADESLWPELEKLKAEKLIYISCNPATFARDWARIKKHSPYKIISIQPFDMFPQTFHVELVALIQRNIKNL